MKKFLAICVMIIMLVSVSLSAFAAPGEFVKSVSLNPAPELVSATSESKDCNADLIITPYIDRASLPKELKELIEKAYKEIAGSKNIALLCESLAELAKALNIPEMNLAVSDMFDIRYESCEEHSEHGYFDIVIKSDTFKNFVGLLHLSDDGWELIEGAEVKEVDGDYHLMFKVDDFSPFAVVVNAPVVVEENPGTGDNNAVFVYAAILIASAVAVFVVLLKKNKKQAV